MAYDKDSDVNPFKSQPGNPQNGQFDIVKQELTSIPLGKSDITSIPLNKVETTSIPLSKIETTSIQLSKTETTSMPLSKTDTTSTPLSNRAKQIDMLSMEEFGHNISKLRKNLSITDATQVNTDREYGVMQIEDDFEFKTFAHEDITFLHGTGTAYNLRNIKRSNAAGVTFDAMGSLQIGTTYTNEHIVPTQVINRTNTNIGNISWLSLGAGTAQMKRGDTGATLSESATSGGTLLADVLIATLSGFYFNSTCNSFNISVNNNGSSGDQIWIRYAHKENYFDADPTYVTTAAITNGNVDSQSANWGGTDRNFFVIEMCFQKSGELTPTAWIPICYYNSYQSDTDAKGFTFAINKNTFSYLTYKPQPSSYPTVHQAASSPGFLASKLVECSITLTIADDIGGRESKSITLEAGTFIGNIAKTIYTVDAAVNNMLDYNYFDYFCGDGGGTPGTITAEISAIAIDTDDNGFAIARVSNAKLFASKNIIPFPVDYTPVEYYKLSNVSNSMSIGIIKRSNNQLSIGAKIGANYYTAANDTPYASTELILSAINIVERTATGFAFTILIGENRYYYTIRELGDYDGGKLLDANTSKQVYFCRYQLTKYTTPAIVTNAAGFKDGFVSSFSSDNNIYINTLDKSPLKLGLTTKLTTGSAFGLVDSYVIFNELIDYVVKGLHIPLMMTVDYLMDITVASSVYSYDHIEGSHFLTITNMPTLGEASLGYPYSTLPLRLVDEFPEIASNGELCDESFTLGKSKFVSKNGNLYEAGSLSLVANRERLYLSELGTIYFSAGYFLLAKDTDDTATYGLTNVYSFTEFGMQLLLVIEDKIICNPVKTSIGIICCGKTGIWVVSENQVRKIWKSEVDIVQASLKTDLDNCCVAIIDNDGAIPIYLTDGSDLRLTDGSDLFITNSYMTFTAITINQFGNVSSQEVTTTINDANFVDIGATAELLMIDLASGGDINYIDKVDPDGTDTYIIQSNQNSEFYQETVYAELVKVKVFAMGTGTIVLAINGTTVESVELSGVTRYTEYSFNVSSVAMQMLDYMFTVDNGVKLLQRVIGVIIPKEEYYG